MSDFYRFQRDYGDVFTLPDGRVLRVDKYEGEDRREKCRSCALYTPADSPAFFSCGHYANLAGYCFGRVFTLCATKEETSAPSISVPSLSGMDDAFRRHVLTVARAEFVALFWDMQNTDLAAAMGVTEKTVRNIRKKRLRKNRDNA